MAPYQAATEDLNMTTAATKKITKATFKSFVKKNLGKLYIRKESDFNGMTDGTDFYRDAKFVEVDCSKFNIENDNNFGLRGVWLVGSSNNYFSRVDTAEHFGIHVYNCCGSFDLVIKK